MRIKSRKLENINDTGMNGNLNACLNGSMGGHMRENVWLTKSIWLGAVFFLAILLVKPIGVSTQFSVLSGIFHSALDESVITENTERKTGHESTNAYYDKNDGKLAKAIRNPWNYDFVFVLTIPLGAYAAYAANHKKHRSQMSHVGEAVEQKTQGFIRHILPSFLGGFIILYGARMADGCTSGHMMSGIMQGSVSGYLFAAAAFAVAIPTALFSARLNH